MKIAITKPLFAWDALEDSPSLQTLREFLAVIPDGRLLDSLHIPQDRLFAENFARIGHVTVSDAFINLAQCHGLVPGRPLLLFARGVGGFSAAALLVR